MKQVWQRLHPGKTEEQIKQEFAKIWEKSARKQTPKKASTIRPHEPTLFENT